jgi:hypothetical protein
MKQSHFLLALVSLRDPRLTEADSYAVALATVALLAAGTSAALALGKKKFILGTGLLLACLALSWCAVCPRTQTAFEWEYRYRVQAGMTLADVENLLGPGRREEAPPGTTDWKGGTIPLVRGVEFYTAGSAASS